jgi:hypothetical protein
VVILAVGGRFGVAHEHTEGVGSDPANKEPPQQLQLIDAITAVGKPTIAVSSGRSGRPHVGDGDQL